VKTTTVYEGTYIEFRPGWIMSHTGAARESGDVRWIAPTTGEYLINLEMVGDRQGGVSSGTGKVILNGDYANPIATGSMAGLYENEGATPWIYNQAIALGTGNYLDFVVDETMSSGNGFAMRLDVWKVPEPSTLVLLASGLIGLVCYAWRKRK
jgi:hypothetical protein